MATSSSLDDQIISVLSRIYDPCSLAARVPISIYDMGLIVGWSSDRYGKLSVRMRTTTPGCTMVPHFVMAAERELSHLPGVESVDIDMSDDTFWTPDFMSRKAQQALDHAREASRTALPVAPQQWRLPGGGRKRAPTVAPFRQGRYSKDDSEEFGNDLEMRDSV